MQLSEAQIRQLKQIALGPKPMHGSAIVRVQNKLISKGLAYAVPDAIVGHRCKITNLGRAWLDWWALRPVKG